MRTRLITFIVAGALFVIGAIQLQAQSFTPYPGNGAISCNGTTTTGACAGYAFSGVYSQYTWQVVVAGGVLSALTVNFIGSVDLNTNNGGQFDQSTAVGGEVRSIVNKPSRAVWCNVVTYTVSSGTPTVTCQFVAKP